MQTSDVGFTFVRLPSFCLLHIAAAIIVALGTICFVARTTSTGCWRRPTARINLRWL